MARFTTEADARILVDDALRQAGWDPSDKSQVLTEVYIHEVRASDIYPGEATPSIRTTDGDEIPTGHADYVLLDQRGRPLAVIEAKRDAIHPYRAKQQALPYAKAVQAPFIFLTNGELIYFWDYTNDDARVVDAFYSRRDLERVVTMRQQRRALAEIPIPDYYLRHSEQRHVRPYQQDAMRALDQAFELGKRRFLIELPTGTGKTDIIALYLKRLFEAGRAERVLFLVDRDQLAKQAIDAMVDLLPAHSSYWLQAGAARQEKEITVCLLQTMISRHTEFSAGYFDIVIADECHRSIYGSWQGALTHFDAVHIGLTATPAAYIERNTFQFYGCKDGEPDFSYPIREAFEAGYLAPYAFASGITVLLAEGADVDGEHYDPFEFERKWTNADSNRKMMEEFDRLAHATYKDLAPGQKHAPGKAIVFAITKRHATILAEILNRLHPEHKGRYAEVITSDVANAEELIRKFKQDEFPMVAVSVDMLTTGFDCPEVLHLVLCRRIHSPILYQQVRGRGTRTCTRIGKKKFIIYDFFRNHEYFNDSDADVFTGTGSGRGRGGEAPPTVEPRELIELGLQDEWLEAVSYVEVGPEGERIDKRKYVSTWEETIRAIAVDDPTLQKLRLGQPLTDEEEQTLTERLNKPTNYFNEENLRRAYREPARTIVDFIRYALGLAKVKSPEETINENFQAWLVTKSFTPQQAQYLALLKNRGIVKGQLQLTDLFQPPLSILDAAGLGVELFGEQRLKEVLEDLNASVFPTRVSAVGA